MVVKFWVAAPWIAGRLYRRTNDTFGHPPLQVAVEQPIYATAGSFYISGSPERLQQSLSDPALTQYVQAHPAGPSKPPRSPPTTGPISINAPQAYPLPS